MFDYFPDGLRHLITGLVFWGAYRLAARGRAGDGFSFAFGLVIGSSALFFLPNLRLSPRWLDLAYRFLHFPLPDWDILTLGMPWHRNFATHSLIAPLGAAVLLSLHVPLRPLARGLLVGAASHLVHDAITGSSFTAIVFTPGLPKLIGHGARIWLAANGAILFSAAVGAMKNGTDPV